MRKLSLRSVLVAAIAALVVGCIAVIPIMIKKHEEEGFVAVQFDVQGNAGELYAKSVDYSVQKNPTLKVVQDDRKNLSFEGQSTRDGRDYDMKWTVKQLDAANSQFNFQAKGTEGGNLVPAAEMGKVADEAVQNFCNAIGKKCQTETVKK